MSARKLLVLVLVSLLALGITSAARPVRAATQIVFTFTPPAGVILAGDTFSVPVTISVPADKPFTGGQFNLSWDPAKLDLVDVTAGTFFGTATCQAGATITPFSGIPTINHAAGTMTNYYHTALGIPLDTGCSGVGNFVTLNFQAVATGRSTNLVSGVLLSDQSSQQYAATDYSFPGFTQFVGEKLVITDFVVRPAGSDSGNFTARVTMANQGSVASVADSATLTTDGDATPLNQNGIVPVIAAGGNVVVDITGFSLVAGKDSSVVTLKFGDQTLTDTYIRTYSTYLPVTIR